MASRSELMKERMRARRSQMNATAAESSDPDHTPRQRSEDSGKWASGWKEDTVDHTTESGTRQAATIEMEDEVKQSELLVDNLKKRRKRTQKELSRTLQATDGDDVKEQLRSAKRQTKQRFLDETQRSATEGEETAASADPEDSMSIPQLNLSRDDDEDGSPRGLKDAPSGASLTGRTPRSARDESQTPRRVSTSLASSIRAKLSQKLRAAKDKGKDEAYDETRQADRMLKGKRSLGRSTRFDDPSVIEEEQLEAEEMLQKSLVMKKKWKDVIDGATGEKITTDEVYEELLPDEDEAYDFFTRQFEAEDDPDEEEAGGASGEGATEGDDDDAGAADGGQGATEGEEGASGGKKKKKKKTKSEEEEPLLEDMKASDESWRLYQISKAEYTPFHERTDTEDKIYFVPSILQAPLESRIDTDTAPRCLEDEGFYVGKRPAVPPKNLHRMENRLLKEGEHNKTWFGEDGVLVALPDPLKEIPSRPPILEELDPAITTDYKKAVMTAQNGRYIDQAQDDTSYYQLDVDINTLRFSHHHLYSREHCLASRLSALYAQYSSRSKNRVAELLTEKLNALKSAANHVQANIESLSSQTTVNEQAVSDQQKRLHDYKDEIKQTRKQREAEMLTDRMVSRHLIHTWRDIKTLREAQKYANTSVKVAIKKDPSDKAADEAQWERDLQDELNDIKHDAETKYNEELTAYHTDMDRWKQQRLDKKEAFKRKKKRDKRISRREQPEDEDADMDEAEKDQVTLEAEELPKPEKPKLLTDSEARQRITDRYNEIRRAPGEPRLSFELSTSGTITPSAQCSKEEQKRRAEVDRHKIFIKVFFNNKEVSTTADRALSQDFTVRFASIFNIEIMQLPENIRIELYERVGMSSTLMSTVYADTPESNVTVETVTLDDVDFVSDIIKTHQHAGVGSGPSPPAESSPDLSVPQTQKTAGVFSHSVAWAVDDQGNVLIPPQVTRGNQVYSAVKGVDAVAAIGVSGMSDMEELTKWVAESHLDPNDPTNAELMCLLRIRYTAEAIQCSSRLPTENFLEYFAYMPPSGGDLISNLRIPDHFRLEQLQEEFNFASDEDIEASLRYRMIQLREQEVTAFRNKVVPAFDKEISSDTFAEYEKQKKDEEKLKKLDEAESHRVAVAKFMQKIRNAVREQVMTRFRYLSHQKTLSEMVFEDAVPNIGTILPTLLKLTEPRRPLRPTRKDRKKVTAQNLQGHDVKVLVNIVRAFGIPVRTAEQGSAEAETARAQGGTARTPRARNLGTETQVRPYIEVMFQRQTQATSVADGPNPSWNEELALPFKPPNNDFSPSNLQTVKDVLYFNIFDEHIVDVVQDDRERGTSIHRRIEKKWLGSIQIPFSTIYFNARIEGTFRINKPPVLLGYSHDSKRAHTEGDIDIGVGESTSTYMTLFVTVVPALQPSEPVREKFDSNEDEKLLQAADTWLFDLEKKHPSREYKATVVDINGKSVFVTRYLRSLKPPEELLEGDSLDAKCDRVARYVSMIPFVSDSVIFPGLCDIWSTCDQFLQMLQGDEEEHAVLLANYFKHLGKKVYLLLGSAIPEGPTAYVMTEEGRNHYMMWNASTGEKFSYRDNYCPVQSIGCLITEDNVYANIQPHDAPSRVSYDVNNNKMWKPFFHKGFPYPGITSVQPSELLYFPTDKNFVMDLSEKIERVLKEKIMEWRSRYITRWNRYCMQAFRRLLPKLEDSRGKPNVQQEHFESLDQILGSYKLCGFPINLPYTDMDPIVDAVFATGVHNYESSEVEFSLAVHIHPYPNSVLSVWVYVANLVRKR